MNSIRQIDYLLHNIELVKYIVEHKDIYEKLKCDKDETVEKSASKILVEELKEILKEQNIKATISNFPKNIIIQFEGTLKDVKTCGVLPFIPWQSPKVYYSTCPFNNKDIYKLPFHEKITELLNCKTGFPLYMTVSKDKNILLSLTSFAKIDTFVNSPDQYCNFNSFPSDTKYTIKLQLNKYCPAKFFQSIGFDYHDRIKTFLKNYNLFKEILVPSFNALKTYNYTKVGLNTPDDFSSITIPNIYNFEKYCFDEKIENTTQLIVCNKTKFQNKNLYNNKENYKEISEEILNEFLSMDAESSPEGYCYLKQFLIDNL